MGLLKGTGRGLVGLLVRPTGGLVDLASGTLDFVTRFVCTRISNAMEYMHDVIPKLQHCF